MMADELGLDPALAFRSLDPTPIGAASIAQAHRARLPDGSEVVVKIQYPWIADALASDLRILRGALRLALRLSGRSPAELDFDRLFDEFAGGLENELDFREEARTAAQIANNLADLDAVVVPRIVGDRSTRRVLTMSFHPCVRIDDLDGLRALGVRPAAVLEILARAYAKQVFVDGLFHADPHPGNLFVLETPDAAERPQVLFVDFGLCRSLAPELRKAMREGIYAVLQRDLDTFVARMNEMGMIAPGAEAGVRDAVAAMFERLAGEGGGRGMLGASTSSVIALKDEAKQLLQRTPGLQLPNDLLLYAKTLSYLFALGEALDTDVDLMKIALPYLLRFLAASDVPA
jgi:predicted unusual protein kinase regulating ubiquinone biosynthesis (AarF/ABC1/UbiB family)